MPAVRYQWYTPQVNAGIPRHGDKAKMPQSANLENMELVQTIIDAQGRVLRLVRTTKKTIHSSFDEAMAQVERIEALRVKHRYQAT